MDQTEIIMNLIIIDKSPKESNKILCKRMLLFTLEHDIFSHVLTKYNLELDKYQIISFSYEYVQDETVAFLSLNFGNLYYVISKDIKLSPYKVIDSLRNVDFTRFQFITNYKDYQKRKSQISSKSNENYKSSKKKTIIPLTNNNYIRLQNEKDLSYCSYGNTQNSNLIHRTKKSKEIYT